MKDNPSEDQFHNPPGLHVALTRAIADNDEDMMALEEATLQDGSSTEMLDHGADDVATERQQLAIHASMRATMLENQLERARAEVRRLNRPMTLDDAMPVLELYRQLIRIVCPLSDFDREKWIRSRDRCLGLQRRFLEKGEGYRLIQMKCEEMRQKCGRLREKCVAICEYYDKFQERVNSLFAEDEEEDEELYDMMRGSMGENEQRLEGLLDEASELMQMIEDQLIWAFELERKSAYNIHQLRCFEGILDDILRSFDYWFGGL
ncbi:hypothetical protein GGI35DRAFT_137550 [Trichoderma velutinum]